MPHTTQDLDLHITCFLVITKTGEMETEMPDLNEVVPEEMADEIQITQNAPELPWMVLLH